MHVVLFATVVVGHGMSPNFRDISVLSRLERSREAASQARARKKSSIKSLEVKYRMLEAHIAQLQQLMTLTSVENAALKNELARVKEPKGGVENGVVEPAELKAESIVSMSTSICSPPALSTSVHVEFPPTSVLDLLPHLLTSHRCSVPDSLQSEFLRHHSCHSSLAQQALPHNTSHFRDFLLTLLRLLTLGTVINSSRPQTSPLQPPYETIFSTF